MYLSDLFKSTSEKYPKKIIEGISFDSRKVKKNHIFFAINGNRQSGTKFINEAILRGASVIVCNKKSKYKDSKIFFLFVKDVRKSLAEACSNFYKEKPSNIIAITGTNGKSSVADFFYQILNNNKIPVATIGTLGLFSKNYKKKTNLTSADPLFLHKNLQILAKKKINHLVLEASSHGLDQKRLDYLNIKTGIFTNLSHDHLDYHKTMKSYLKSKLYLFEDLLNKNSKIITDEENKEFKKIKNIARKKKISILSIGNISGNIRILQNVYKENEQITKISLNSKIYTLKISLIGFFQVKNLLMAILAAISCGINKNKIFNQINKIKPTSGRLEIVASLKNNSRIIIDFAHTPDALEQALIAIKKQFKKEIIIVFGCGGDRDKKKRIPMGIIAKKYCRKIFITDDNPRNENPKKIRNEIMKGCKSSCVNIGSRKKAIEYAINELQPNEILLIAGKGHEKKQDYGNKVFNFCDKKIVNGIIRKKKSFFGESSYKNFLLKSAFNNNKLKNINYNGVSINTKTIKKNNLFFAIRGKKKDGHEFVKYAIKKGAVKSIISSRTKQFPVNKTIRVKNTFSSLNNLAKVTRDNTSAKIIGITGSVGKTTLKNLISFSLKNYGKVYHSPHSYNNKFGVPLSVSNLKKNTEYGIFEIGMDKKGEINNLSKIVKPEIAIVTNIAEAHFKNFISLKDIAKTKAEIINNVIKGGTVILNKDDKFFNFLLKRAKIAGINTISFSYKKKADIFLTKVKKFKKHYMLKININNKIFYFKTSFGTNSFIYNILACVSVLYILNLDLRLMNKKFINFTIPSGRGDIKLVKKFKKRFKFIDESYNANPLSMSTAIKNMSSYKRKNNIKKLVLLGDMLELGKKSIKLHKELSTILNKSDIDRVFVYGKDIIQTFNSLSINKKGKVFFNLDEAYKHFSKIIHNNDLLMVKGSNATGLNKFSQNIKRGKISAL